MTIIGVCLAYCQATVQARTRDERGASFIEYALLTSLIAVVCLVAVNFIGTTTGESLSSTGSMMDRP